MEGGREALDLPASCSGVIPRCRLASSVTYHSQLSAREILHCPFYQRDRSYERVLVKIELSILPLGDVTHLSPVRHMPPGPLRHRWKSPQR